MRPLWIVAAIACGVFALAGIASASVREEARSLVATVAAATALPDEASPSPQPSPSGPESPAPTPSETAAPEETEDETPVAGTHGAAVSQVARDKEAVGTKTLRNGKTVTNHGMAVSAAAHTKAGTSTEAVTKANGKGKSGR